MEQQAPLPEIDQLLHEAQVAHARKFGQEVLELVIDE